MQIGLESPNIPNSVKDALRSIITSARAEEVRRDRALANVRIAAEQWFDDAMDRVSGWYKRQAQLIVLALALAVSISMNADTFVIVNTLYSDTTLRAAVVAAAEARDGQELPGA